jgi:predicted nucleotidyltransferase component of viral defense system
MISKRELESVSAQWGVRLDVIEKDYALGWLLAGIAQHQDLSNAWIFKGGTCLRKCYYETFRFSEDLDFTVIEGGPEQPKDLTRIFLEISEWLREANGLVLIVDDDSFRRKVNRRGKETTQGKIAYTGPNTHPGLPKIKIDLTSDEVLVRRPELRAIRHHYTDSPLPVSGVLSYSITELFGEKLRALTERCRPRDLYDVVHLRRHPDLIGKSSQVAGILLEKCLHAGIDVPTFESMNASSHDEIENDWSAMLSHQLPEPLIPFSQFWAELDQVFNWLDGKGSVSGLPRAQYGDLDQTWISPHAITSWHSGFPINLLRYAGANRLKVQIDYRAETGRSGPRTVEPYSLRRTRDGKIVLFVVNELGKLRSYRTDRIAGIQPTSIPFIPQYRIELY